MRKCFICDSTEMCEHREPDLCTAAPAVATITGPLFRSVVVLSTRKPAKKATKPVENNQTVRIDSNCRA